jgi:hypothetical protein
MLTGAPTLVLARPRRAPGSLRTGVARLDRTHRAIDACRCPQACGSHSHFAHVRRTSTRPMPMVGGMDRTGVRGVCRSAAESRTQSSLRCIEAHVKWVTERLEARAEQAGVRLNVDGQPPSERLHLAAIRGIADELDRSLAQTSSQPRLSLRRQLAEELERLARELRQNDSTVDDEERLRR